MFAPLWVQTVCRGTESWSANTCTQAQMQCYDFRTLLTPGSTCLSCCLLLWNLGSQQGYRGLRKRERERTNPNNKGMLSISRSCCTPLSHLPAVVCVITPQLKCLCLWLCVCVCVSLAALGDHAQPCQQCGLDRRANFTQVSHGVKKDGQSWYEKKTFYFPVRRCCCCWRETHSCSDFSLCILHFFMIPAELPLTFFSFYFLSNCLCFINHLRLLLKSSFSSSHSLLWPQECWVTVTAVLSTSCIVITGPTRHTHKHSNKHKTFQTTVRWHFSFLAISTCI